MNSKNNATKCFWIFIQIKNILNKHNVLQRNIKQQNFFQHNNKKLSTKSAY